MKRTLALLLAMTVSLVIAGCSKDEEEKAKVDPEGAADKVTLGLGAAMEAMESEDQDFTQAYNLFEQAAALDPNNMEAHAGAGAMNILRLPNHPSIAPLIDELGIGELLGKADAWRVVGYPPQLHSAAVMRYAILTSLREPKALQTDLSDVIDIALAQIQVSINHFNRVETDPDFVWKIPVSEGGLPMDTLEVDVTDIHFVEAPLHFIKAILLCLNAYNLDLPSADLAGMVEAMNPDSDFLTLVNASSMQSAPAAINDGADESHTGALLLAAEIDDQTDDAVRLLFPEEESGEWMLAMTEGMRDTLEAMPTMVDDLMDEPLSITDDFDSDDDTPDVTILVDVAAVFDDPIESFKAVLPDYELLMCEAAEDTTLGITWGAATIDDWTWHPELLNGLLTLPGGPMTSDDMVSIFGLEGMFEIGTGCP